MRTITHRLSFYTSLILLGLFMACGSNHTSKENNAPSETPNQETSPPPPSASEDKSKKTSDTLSTAPTSSITNPTTPQEPKDIAKNTNTSPKEDKPEPKKETPPPVRTKRQYDKVFPVYQGLALVQLGDKFGFVNSKGEEIVAPLYDYAEEFLPGTDLARVRKADRVGCIDRTGTEIIPLKFRYIEKFRRGLALARLPEGGKHFIDRQGNIICDFVDEYAEGMARVKREGKVGYVDNQGNLTVPALYDYGTRFEGGMAHVKQGTKHFYINKKGECVKDCQ